MLKAALLLALACGVVWLVVMWREGGPRSFGDMWKYPGATGFSSTRHPRLIAVEMQTADLLPAVAAYYDGRADIKGGDPMFMHRGGPFGGRSLVAKHSFSVSGAKPGTLLIHWNKRELSMIQHWAFPTNAPARVTASALDFRFPENWPMWNTSQAMQDLACPGAKHYSGGSAGWVSTALFTTTNSFAVVWDHYLKTLPTGSNALSSGSGAVFTNGIPPAARHKPADLILLPVATTPGLEQKSMVHLWNSRLVLVWVWRAAGDKETQILQALAVGE
jgi:hypothetical protein